MQAFFLLGRCFLGYAFLALLVHTACAKGMEDDEWFKGAAHNVYVYTNVDRRTAGVLLKGIYNIQQLATLIPGVSLGELNRPLEILVVEKKSDLRKLGARGFTLLQSGSNFRRHRLVVRDWPNANELSFIFRSVAHLLIHNSEEYAGIHWLHEGLGSYLAGVEWNSEHVSIGVRPAHIVDRLYSAAWLKPKWILEADSARQIVRHQYSKFIAQTWILTHYLLSNATEEKPVSDILQEYRQNVAAGYDEILAFEVATDLDADSLTKTLKSYHRECCLVYKIAAPQAAANYSATIDAMSREEVSLVLGREALVQGSIERARGWLKIAATDKALQSAAQAELGNLEYTAGNPEAALAYYQSAVALAPQSLTANLDLARYWIREAESATDAAIRQSNRAQADKILVDAWKLDNQNAEVYFLTGRSRLLQKSQADDAIEMFEEAAFFQPDNHTILKLLAETYLANDNRAEALRVTELLGRMTHGNVLSELEESVSEALAEDEKDAEGENE